MVERAERNAKLMRVLGWFWAALIGVVAWHLVLILGIAAVEVLDSRCPPDQVVSGECMAKWYAPAVDVLMIVFAGLSAVAVVLVPPLVVPSHRWSTALVMDGVGATVAIVFAAAGMKMWAPAASALIAGAASVLVARALWKHGPAGPAGPNQESRIRGSTPPGRP